VDRLSVSISRPPSAPRGNNLHDPALGNSRAYQLASKTVLMSNEVAEYPPPDREGSRKRHGQLALRWEIRHVAVDEIGPARAGATQDATSILSAPRLLSDVTHHPPLPPSGKASASLRVVLSQTPSRRTPGTRRRATDVSVAASPGLIAPPAGTDGRGPCGLGRAALVHAARGNHFVFITDPTISE